VESLSGLRERLEQNLALRQDSLLAGFGSYGLPAGPFFSAAGSTALLPSGLHSAAALAAIDDFAASTATTGLISVGSSSSGNLETLRDRDWFAVDLIAGRTYALRENGVSLADPLLRLRNSSGSLLASNDDISSTNRNSLITYRPSASGRYYLEAGAFKDALTGTYQVSVTDVTPLPPVDDYAASTATTGVVAVGGSSSGTLEVKGDHDWFKVSVQAGRTYSFSLNGSTLADPLLTLLDSSGTVLASNDDASSSTRNSLITYTASSSTTLYLDAAAYLNAYTGTYAVAVTDVTPPAGYSSIDGYGQANVARALDLLTGQPIARQNPLGGVFWGLDAIGAPSAWAAGVTGAGITVAVVDTGVDYTHSELSGNIWTNPGEIAGDGIDNDGNGYIDDIHGWDFVGNDNDPMDLNGHGTHVSGTIAAANNGIGQTGVAYNSRIMPVRVLDASGSGSLPTIAAGIRYATANGARVINLSLGGTSGSIDLQSAISDAAARGVVVVMAAGNSGTASPSYPAAYAVQNGLAIGAVDASGTMASFSNRSGSTPLDYVTAPGVNLYSTWLNNTYSTISGTSMASPHVSGIAALLLSAQPSLSASQVEALITGSASHGSGVFSAAAAGSTGTITGASTASRLAAPSAASLGYRRWPSGLA